MRADIAACNLTNMHPPPLFIIIAMVAMSIFPALVTHGTVYVEDSDIIDETWSFTALGHQLPASSVLSQVNGAWYSDSRVDWRSENSNRYYANPWNDPTQVPGFILAWDFSRSARRPISFEVSDKVYFSSSSSGTTVKIEWSTDLIDWHLIRTVSSTGTDLTSAVTSGPIPLSTMEVAPTRLYYRVLFSTSGTFGNGGLATQWGRSAPDVTAFSIRFDLEPAAPPPSYSIEGRTLLRNGKPVRGVFAHWHVNATQMKDEPAIRAEMRKMKSLFSLRGFAFELGWNRIEAARGQFVFPEEVDRFLEIAEEEGLHVQILLTPHYTPDWVYNQGIDVRMKDENGTDINGIWLNYSPSSPAALQWQGEFQSRAIEYYQRFSSVSGFHLTNELTYGRSDLWKDYSSWAEAVWEDWLTTQGLPVASLPKPAEASIRTVDWSRFVRFRQDMLTDYFNTVYAQATAALDRFIPVFHRHNWYAASDAYANRHGLNFDPAENLGDCTGGNVYGVNEIMAAMWLSWQRPVNLTETSLPSLADAENGTLLPGSLNSAFLRQFFYGADIQTVYQWSSGNFYPMLSASGGAHPAFSNFSTVVNLIDRVDGPLPEIPDQVGYLWPRTFAALRSAEYQHLQHLFRTIMASSRRLGRTPVMIFPGQVELDADPLHSVRLLHVTRHFGNDQDILDHPALENWVASGGTLLMELDSISLPPTWSGIQMATGTTGDIVAVTGGPLDPMAAIPATAGRQGFARASVTEVWAEWSDPAKTPAIVTKDHGDGKIIAVGTAAFASLPHSFYAVIDAGTFADQAQSGESILYYRLGKNVLAQPQEATQAVTSLPASWTAAASEFWSIDRDTGLATGVAPSGTTSGYITFSLPVGSHLLVIDRTAAAPPPPLLLNAVSRKTHGLAGTFDIPLAVTTTAGGNDPAAASPVECRRGDTLTLVLAFDKPVSSLEAAITAGTATVACIDYEAADRSVTIHLTGVANAQLLQITLQTITGSDGGTAPAPATIGLSILNGDTNGDGRVNTDDVDLTKSRAAAPLDALNFRSDVTTDGNMNTADVNFIKSLSGTSVE
ncbi:beta-galactosidase [Opitutaceae bacterium TAV1]|nr:beta-galactosidase [Opitutaceae bacterium TAV1]